MAGGAPVDNQMTYEPEQRNYDEDNDKRRHFFFFGKPVDKPAGQHPGYLGDQADIC
tara:strand:- start:266 stop:433 length:168 start_codon:yes stop_codon:yes gene_type:complete